jgi:hypothetical protein
MVRKIHNSPETINTQDLYARDDDQGDLGCGLISGQPHPRSCSGPPTFALVREYHPLVLLRNQLLSVASGKMRY